MYLIKQIYCIEMLCYINKKKSNYYVYYVQYVNNYARNKKCIDLIKIIMFLNIF